HQHRQGERDDEPGALRAAGGVGPVTIPGFATAPAKSLPRTMLTKPFVPLLVLSALAGAGCAPASTSGGGIGGHAAIGGRGSSAGGAGAGGAAGANGGGGAVAAGSGG